MFSFSYREYILACERGQVAVSIEIIPVNTAIGLINRGDGDRFECYMLDRPLLRNLPLQP